MKCKVKNDSQSLWSGKQLVWNWKKEIQGKNGGNNNKRNEFDR